MGRFLHYLKTHWLRLNAAVLIVLAAFAYGVRLILDGVEAALRRHNREKNAHMVVGKRSGSMRTKLEQRP